MSNNKFIYSVGYGSPEDSYFLFLEHKKEFNEKELAECVEVAIMDVLELTCIDEKMQRYFSSYDDTGPSFAEIMTSPQFEESMNRQGFTSIRPDVSCTWFGWIHVFAREGWKSYASDEQYELIERLYDKFYHRLKCLERDPKKDLEDLEEEEEDE